MSSGKSTKLPNVMDPNNLTDNQFDALSKQNLLSPYMDEQFLLAWVQGKNPATEKHKKSSSSKKRKGEVISPKSAQDTFDYQYTEEILKMLHAFGDVAKPHVECARLLEKIAKKYVTEIVLKIKEQLSKEEVSPNKKKGKKTAKGKPKPMKLTVEILKDVMEKIEPGLGKRVMEIVDFIRKNRSVVSLNEEVEHLDEVEAVLGEDIEEESIQSEPTTIESDSIFSWALQDADKNANANNAHNNNGFSELELNNFHQALAVRDKLSQKLTKEEYIYFAECSKMSFTRPLKRNKFGFWCSIRDELIGYDNDSIDVLGQLVYEKIRSIVWKIKAEQVKGIQQGSPAPKKQKTIGNTEDLIPENSNPFDFPLEPETLQKYL